MVNHSNASRTTGGDGTSTTIILAEDAGRPQRWRVGKLISAQVADTAASWADRNNLIAPTGSLPDGSKRLGPCAMNCTNSNEIYGFHYSGSNVVFIDGSARFISQSVSIKTIAALITRAGREKIAEEY